MTLANKLTIFRIILIPIMIMMLFIPGLDGEVFWEITIAQLIFACLYLIAAATDFLDGYIARKYDQVTTFGKFLDPIADKLLVVTTLAFLIKFPYWNEPLYIDVILVSLIIIIIREFIVTGVRLVAVEKNVVIAASPLGKLKTAFTMITLILMLFNGFHLSYLINSEMPDYISLAFLLVSVILTVLSGVDYVIKNRKIITESI